MQSQQLADEADVGTPESGCMTGALPSCPFIMDATGAEVAFCKRIIGNFIVHQNSN